MLRNYLTVVSRNIVKHKGYSFINIFGLSIGIAGCILILLWVNDELSYDRFHKNADQLYRVVIEENGARRVTTPSPLAPAAKAEIPGVLDTVRYMNVLGMVKHGEKSFNEICAFTEPSFFDMFTAPFIKGNPKNVFSDPLSVVITEEIALKYFADEDPVGQTLNISNKEVTVAGLIKNFPANTHLKAKFLGPYSTLKMLGMPLDNWRLDLCFTYLLLDKEVSHKEVGAKLTRLIQRHRPGTKASIFLQPLTRIHLYSDFKYDVDGHGSIKYVYIFSIMALFLILIACINFMNLTTARAGDRAKEISLRKVVGANRGQLIKQFFYESGSFSLIALVIALLLVKLFLPTFRELTGKELSMDFFTTVYIFLDIIGIVILTGIAAGAYPALFLSSFQPAQVLKGKLKKSRRSLFRGILVVLQFSISILLIICTLVVSGQLSYINNRDLGFDKSNLIYMKMRKNLEQYKSVRQELLRNPNILNAAAADHIPISFGNETDQLDWEGREPEEKISMQVMSVDYHFLETFKMKIVKGRGFSENYSTDWSEAYIVNETAVKEMDLESPVGKRFAVAGKDGRIIGVVQDFNLSSLHHAIVPVVLKLSPKWYSYLCLRVKPVNIPDTIQFLREKWHLIDPGWPFEYNFLDEAIDKMYRTEQRTSEIFIYFTILSILTSCLGLFALASFIVEKRTKEISIRKVFGASGFSVFRLMSKEFVILVAIANLVAWPAAYFTMNKWLLDFAYRSTLGIGTFLAAGITTVIIVIITISSQTIKAARTNLVENLKYE